MKVKDLLLLNEYLFAHDKGGFINVLTGDEVDGANNSVSHLEVIINNAELFGLSDRLKSVIPRFDKNLGSFLRDYDLIWGPFHKELYSKGWIRTWTRSEHSNVEINVSGEHRYIEMLPRVPEFREAVKDLLEKHGYVSLYVDVISSVQGKRLAMSHRVPIFRLSDLNKLTNLVGEG